ncbi:hypothetical protein BofuT4_P113360.1 [Botrytis cinerea T4]|uniref:Uncharacterized protein n=1 Tax=Botryotinia fuckeliana (strain T4) TaxID=999810 RepID=G2Y5T6_BOTF4|nr:hypothetical protein BofuT4_P113360.1 [Botrytis cinerea T4]
MDRETIKVPIFLAIISMHHDSIIHLPAEEGGTINRKQLPSDTSDLSPRAVSYTARKAASVSSIY